MFERRLFFHIDYLMIIALGALCAVGVMMIYSTTSIGPNSTLYVKQLYAIAIGVVVFVVCLGLTTLVPFLLIAKEPDLGTAITVLTILLGISFLAGMRLRLLGFLLILAIVAVSYTHL